MIQSVCAGCGGKGYVVVTGVELCENETRPTVCSNVPVPFGSRCELPDTGAFLEERNKQLQERAADDGVFYDEN